jgi:hypothetical protein
MAIDVLDATGETETMKTTVDGSGHHRTHTIVDESALPSGAATNAKLDEVVAKLPAALVSGRLSVDVGASALPSGAATNAKLDEVVAKLPAALVSGRLSVDVGASALPSGAATEATLADGLAPLPPQITGTSAPSANATVGSSSTDEVAVGGTGFYAFQCTSEPVTGQNGFFIVFGATGLVAATAANGWHIPPGTEKTFKFPTGTTWFYRCIRAGSVDAAEKHYKSGQ